MIHLEVHDAPFRRETDFVFPCQPADGGSQLQLVQPCGFHEFFPRALVTVLRTLDDAGVFANLFLVHMLKFEVIVISY